MPKHIMHLPEAMDKLPEAEKVLVVLSGGLDSGILTMLLNKKYGSENVVALSYNYGQKQNVELEKARALCKELKIAHTVLDLSILGDIAKPISTNIRGSDVKMPTIKDVLGDPQPPTYVPFRNLILLSLTMAQAEASQASIVFTGLQVHDEYGYWDTTQKFVDSVNAIAEQNRTHKVKIMAPFSHLSKYEELLLCKEIDHTDLLINTLTCYDHNIKGESCGKCPSCAERIQNFAKSGLKDPIPYSIDIPWDDLLDVQYYCIV